MFAFSNFPSPFALSVGVNFEKADAEVEGFSRKTSPHSSTSVLRTYAQGERRLFSVTHLQYGAQYIDKTLIFMIF
jgi:hypothetical protein